MHHEIKTGDVLMVLSDPKGREVTAEVTDRIESLFSIFFDLVFDETRAEFNKRLEFFRNYPYQLPPLMRWDSETGVISPVEDDPDAKTKKED
jgi:hypothetical protein